MRLLLTGLAILSLISCGGGDSGTVSALSAPAPPTALSYVSPQTFTVGTLITPVNPNVTGAVTSYAVAPTLPAGLALNGSTGQISGNPTATAVAAPYTITAQNSGGSTTFSLSITVNAATQAALEPASSTTIGVGQSINVFFSQKVGGAPFASYIDPLLVTWNSSSPARASINNNGVVTALSEGTSIITGQYQSFNVQLTVQVSGTFLARTVAVAGQGVRRYSIYTPVFGSNNTAHSAIIAIHGGGGTAMIQASTTALAKFAQEQLLYVVFLEGTGAIQTFNAGACCGTAQTQNIDDAQYVRTVIDDVQANFNVNAARVFATGFSNGAMMSHRLACALSDRIAGIAAISGGSGQFDKSHTQYYACNPTRPIPVLHIHSTNDRNYPFNGGMGEGISATDFYPVDATIADWIVRNNVTNLATVDRVTPTTTCSRYATRLDISKPSAPVTLCKVDPVDVYDTANKIVFGGGHSWPGGVRSPGASSDVPVTDFNANAYLCAFFNP